MKSPSKPNVKQDERYDHKQWISPIAAVHLLAPVFGGDEAARTVLLSRVREGRLDAWADWVLEEADVGEIAFEDINWSNTYKAKTVVDGHFVKGYLRRQVPGYGVLPLKPDFLSSEDGWVIADDMLDWGVGVFVGRKPAKQHSVRRLPKIPGLMTRKVISGLEFRRSDILEIAGIGSSDKDIKNVYPGLEPSQGVEAGAPESAEAQPPSKADELRNTGNRRSDAWYDWVAEVVVYADLHGIDTEMKAPTFHKEIKDLLKTRGKISPNTDSTEKAFRVIKTRWREHMNSNKLKPAG